MPLARSTTSLVLRFAALGIGVTRAWVPDNANHHRRVRATARVDHYSTSSGKCSARENGTHDRGILRRSKCLKRPASLWVEDEAVPLGGVVAVVLVESPD
jgi:hypothetical protein